MRRRTVYLPEPPKPKVGCQPKQRSEAEATLQPIREAVGRPEPRPGIIRGDDRWADRVDDYLEGFGER